jgi:hypothetical protein
MTPEEKTGLGMDGMTPDECLLQFWSTKNSREYWARRRFHDRRTYFVNCWHINNYESAGMWAGYASGDEGIAIVSNYERVQDALTRTPARLFAGRVEYLDFERERVNNDLCFPLSKRMSFSYENEFRLIYWDLDIQRQVNNLYAILASSMFRGVGQPKRTDQIDWTVIEDDVARIKYSPGRYVDVDIETLIEEVRVSPTSPDWFADLVKSTSKKHGIAANVVRSDLTSSIR